MHREIATRTTAPTVRSLKMRRFQRRRGSGTRFIFPLAATVLLLPLRSNGAPVEIIPAEFRGPQQPQVAVAPAGRIHVTFGTGSAIYHTASPDAGRTFTQPVKVAELPQLALGMRRGPRIAAADRMLAITAISAGDPLAISLDLGGRASAVALQVAGVPARTRIHCRNQPETCRKPGFGCPAGRKLG